MSGEKHEEIPRSSDALFGNNPKVFELPLFSSTSLEDLVRNAQAHHFNLLLSLGSCCGALFITKPRKKLEVDLTHVRKAEKVY